MSYIYVWFNQIFILFQHWVIHVSLYNRQTLEQFFEPLYELVASVCTKGKRSIITYCYYLTFLTSLSQGLSPESTVCHHVHHCFYHDWQTWAPFHLVCLLPAWEMLCINKKASLYLFSAATPAMACMSCLLLPRDLSGHISVIDTYWSHWLTAFVMILNPQALDWVASSFVLLFNVSATLIMA